MSRNVFKCPLCEEEILSELVLMAHLDWHVRSEPTPLADPTGQESPAVHPRTPGASDTEEIRGGASTSSHGEEQS